MGKSHGLSQKLSASLWSLSFNVVPVAAIFHYLIRYSVKYSSRNYLTIVPLS